MDASAPDNPQRTTHRSWSGWRIGLDHFRGFLFLIIALVLAAVVGFFYLKHQVHEQVRAKIEAHLNATLGPLGAECKVEEARFVNGRGIRIRNLLLVDRELKRNVIAIQEMDIASPACFVDLISGNVTADRIVIKEATVYDDVTRSRLKQWLGKLLDSDQQQDLKPIPIQVRDSSIEIQGLFADPEKSIAFHNIDLDLTPFDRHRDPSVATTNATSVSRGLLPPFELSGTIAGNLVERFAFSGQLDLENDWWQCTIETQNANIDGRVLGELPDDFRSLLGPLVDLKGQLNINGSAQGKISAPDQTQFQITGDLNHAQVISDRLPHSIVDGQASFRASESGFEIYNVFARFGLGSIRLYYSQDGLLEARNSHFTANIDRLLMDSQVAGYLPQQIAETQEFLNFSGEINSTIEFKNVDGTATQDLTVELVDTSFAFETFPFRFHHCLGTIKWDGRQCKYSAQAIENDQIIEFRGLVGTEADSQGGWMEVEVHGDIPIDEKLLNAFHVMPESQQIVRSFNLAGRFGYSGRFDQSPTDNTIWNARHDIELKQCSARYDHFEYPVYNLSGKLELINSLIYYKNIKAVHNGGELVINGRWDDHGLNVGVIGQSIPLDDDLRTAIPIEYQGLWKQLQPRGTLDVVKVQLTSAGDSNEINAVIEAEKFKSNAGIKSNLSMKPVEFPYEINHLSGWFKAENGQLTIRNFQGHHGSTWIQCNGSGLFSEDGWQLSLYDYLASSVKVDHDLLVALPKSLANSIRQVHFDGQVNMQGQLSFGQRRIQRQYEGNLVDHTSTAYPVMQAGMVGESTVEYAPFFEWNNMRIDLDGANINVGTPITNLRGSVVLSGVSNHESTRSSGRLALDSLTLNNLQFTSVNGPLWIDEKRLNFGAFARTSSSTMPATVTAQVFGGRLGWDAQFSLEDDHKFFMQTTLNNANLAEFAKNQMPGHTEISGTGYLTMQMGGSQLNRHSLRGNGTVQLRDAKIYEIPVILSLLKILSISEINRTAFDESNIDFTLQGEDIDFQKIELIGDAISIIGNGQLDMQRNIDLNFYTVVGRNRWYIPIISQIYEAGSQQILLLTVDGTLDHPNTHRKVVPQINDSLRSLINRLKPANDDQGRSGGFRLLNPFNR